MAKQDNFNVAFMVHVVKNELDIFHMQKNYTIFCSSFANIFNDTKIST